MLVKQRPYRVIYRMRHKSFAHAGIRDVRVLICCLCCSQLMSNKLKRSSAPPTPRAAAITGHTVAEGDVIARITAGQSYTSSPTKALATLSRKSSGIWNPAAVEPVRVLLRLPAENADTVLEQFQEQVRLWKSNLQDSQHDTVAFQKARSHCNNRRLQYSCCCAVLCSSLLLNCVTMLACMYYN